MFSNRSMKKASYEPRHNLYSLANTKAGRELGLLSHKAAANGDYEKAYYFDTLKKKRTPSHISLRRVEAYPRKYLSLKDRDLSDYVLQNISKEGTTSTREFKERARFYLTSHFNLPTGGVDAISTVVAYDALAEVKESLAPSAGPFGIELFLDFCDSSGLDPNDEDSLEAFEDQYDQYDFDLDMIGEWVETQKVSRKHSFSSGWSYDNKLLAFTSKSPSEFSCTCGSTLTVPGYHNCSCGKIWNAYQIASPQGEQYIAREVLKRDVILP